MRHQALIALTTCLYACAAAADGRSRVDDERAIADPRIEHRSYVFETGERIPYALFVPERYRPGHALPLLVSLHGLGRTHDWLMGYHGLLDLAGQRGYIVVTPLGYTRRGWYGSRTEDVDGRPLGVEAERSEQDVMNVVARVRDEFAVDDDRLFLWGHSMGGAGTWHLAARHPDLWAAIGLVAPAPPQGVTAQALLTRIRDIPAIVIQGSDDQLVPASLTRSWVETMAALGMDYHYEEIEGGDHSLLISEDRNNMRKLFDFFDRH